jgi:DNA polymerase-4
MMKIHLDLDCYFVSAERTRDATLKNRPVVVAKGTDKRIFELNKKDAVMLGNTGAFNSVMEFRHTKGRTWHDEFMGENGKISGIVIAKSYETKPFGIQTGTPLSQALQMCPELIILPSDHLFYQELSQKLKSFLEIKIPLLEQYSIDEFFGDLGGWIDECDTLEFITNLRNEIMHKFDLPITIGASRSKWIAKLITDKTKPYGVRVVGYDEVSDFVNPVKIGEFCGVGKALKDKLNAHKIFTIGELKQRPRLLMEQGKIGSDLLARINGVDNEPIIANIQRKGIGISRNFKAVLCRDEIRRRVIILARYLTHTIGDMGLNPTTFNFKIGYENGLKNSQSITQNRLFSESFMIELTFDIIEKLDTFKSRKIHYIGISATNFLDDKQHTTFSLLEYQDDIAKSKLTQALLGIRKRYGIDMVRYGIESEK